MEARPKAQEGRSTTGEGETLGVGSRHDKARGALGVGVRRGGGQLVGMLTEDGPKRLGEVGGERLDLLGQVGRGQLEAPSR